MTTSIHPDDIAVDNFAAAMKLKLAAARDKGRSGWDNKELCSGEYLAQNLVVHLSRGNSGTFEDIANFAMMLHQRSEDPALLKTQVDLNARVLAEGVLNKVADKWVNDLTDKAAGELNECLCCQGSGHVAELSDGMTLLGRRINELTAELHSVKTIRDALTSTCGLQEQNISRLNEEIRKATQEINALKSHLEAMRGAMTNAVNVIDLIPEGQAAAVYQMEAVLRAGPRHQLAAHDADVSAKAVDSFSMWLVDHPAFKKKHQARLSIFKATNEYAAQLHAKAGAA